jgi:hypothetical protein
MLRDMKYWNNKSSLGYRNNSLIRYTRWNHFLKIAVELKILVCWFYPDFPSGILSLRQGYIADKGRLKEAWHVQSLTE